MRFYTLKYESLFIADQSSLRWGETGIEVNVNVWIPETPQKMPALTDVRHAVCQTSEITFVFLSLTANWWLTNTQQNVTFRLFVWHEFSSSSDFCTWREFGSLYLLRDETGDHALPHRRKKQMAASLSLRGHLTTRLTNAHCGVGGGWWQIQDLIRQASYADVDVNKPCKLAGTSHHAKRRGKERKGKEKRKRNIFLVKRKGFVTTDPLYFCLAFLPVWPGAIACKTVTLLSLILSPSPVKRTGLSQITF